MNKPRDITDILQAKPIIRDLLVHTKKSLPQISSPHSQSSIFKKKLTLSFPHVKGKKMCLAPLPSLKPIESKKSTDLTPIISVKISSVKRSPKPVHSVIPNSSGATLYEFQTPDKSKAFVDTFSISPQAEHDTVKKQKSLSKILPALTVPHDLEIFLQESYPSSEELFIKYARSLNLKH